MTRRSFLSTIRNGLPAVAMLPLANRLSAITKTMVPYITAEWHERSHLNEVGQLVYRAEKKWSNGDTTERTYVLGEYQGCPYYRYLVDEFVDSLKPV